MEIEKLDELYSALTEASFSYKDNLARQSGIPAARERLKNILFTRLSQITDMLNYAKNASIQIDTLTQEVTALQNALADADNEYLELKKKLKDEEKMKTAVTTSPRKKATEVSEESAP